MKRDTSYLSEDKFLILLAEFPLNQDSFPQECSLSQEDVRRIAREATDRRVVNNPELLSRSEALADMLMQKQGYVLKPVEGIYEMVC
jgi:hypothetical protein